MAEETADISATQRRLPLLYDGTGGDVVTNTQQYRPPPFIPPPTRCRPQRIIPGATCRVTGGRGRWLRRTKFVLIVKVLTIAVLTRRARTWSRIASNTSAPLGPSSPLSLYRTRRIIQGRRNKHRRGRPLAEEARVSRIPQRRFLRRYSRPTRTRWRTHKRSGPLLPPLSSTLLLPPTDIPWAKCLIPSGRALGEEAKNIA